MLFKVLEGDTFGLFFLIHRESNNTSLTAGDDIPYYRPPRKLLPIGAKYCNLFLIMAPLLF